MRRWPPSPDFLKRVEVLRDPVFSLYGLDSILPVVNLIDMALGSPEARRVGVEGSGGIGGMGIAGRLFHKPLRLGALREAIPEAPVHVTAIRFRAQLNLSPVSPA